MKFDIYDFDKTVFPYDSETCFLFYCLLRRPWLIVIAPYLLVCLALFFAGFGDKYKGKCFTFLRFINAEKMVDGFWAKREKDIFPFFLPVNRKNPAVVCSASPEFLLRGVCNKYGVHTLVATKMNPKTGKIDGKNCKDIEKVSRLNTALPGAQYENVFSDSASNDIHIFRLGTRCFLTKGGKPRETSLADIEKQVGK